MKYAFLISNNRETSNTAENPFCDKSAYYLNGMRIGKLRVFSDDYEDYEIKYCLVEEHMKTNPDFIARESILIIKNSLSEIIEIMSTLPFYDESVFSP